MINTEEAATSTDDEGEGEMPEEQGNKQNEGPDLSRHESMPFSLQETFKEDEDKSAPTSDSRDPVSSSQEGSEKKKSWDNNSNPSTSSINIHGSHNVVVVVQGSDNKLSVKDAFTAHQSKRHVKDADNDGATSTNHGAEVDNFTMAINPSTVPLSPLQTKDAAGQKIQLGEDLAWITAQETTPTPDSAPAEPFGSPTPAYSQASTVYSPTHTTESDLSGSENAARLAVIDEEDAPSPKSTDDWMSSSTGRSTIASSGDSRYSPTTPVHSDWMSGPSTPDSENPPDSPGEAETPWEILVRGDQAVEAYLRASRNGTKKVYRTRLMLVGQERVGKTSLLKSLIGKEYDKEEEITDGVDTTTVCRVLMKDCVSPWEVQHADKTDRVQHVNAQYNKAVGSSMAQELLEMSQDGEEFQSSLENKQKIEVDIDSAGPSLELLAQDDDLVDASSDKMSQSPSKVKVPQEIRAEALQELQQQASLEAEDQEKTKIDPALEFQFWDFAGQDVYYTTHQVFLNRRAIFVLVYDASQNLKLKSKVDAPFEKESSRYHDFTGGDFIHFWLQSVYAYAVHPPKSSDGTKPPHRTPPVFVVGTHKDGLTQGKNEEITIGRQHQLIYEIIEGKPYEEHVIRQFHMVENSSKNKRDPQLMDLRKHIAEVAAKESYMGERIPLRWFQFEKAVLEAVTKNTTHMNIGEVREMARRFKINKLREFATMLQFYHDLGCIVYFGRDKRGKHNQAVRDVVILDPQWLIDVFKRIITVKPNSKQWSTYCGLWRRLRNEGILEEELIDHVWEDLKELKPTFISLMEMFDLLCPQCIPAEGSKSGQEKKIYYVPACLQPAQEEASTEGNEDSEDGTFYVDFKEFLPDGLFHRVLVHIARWSQEESKIHPKLYYRRGIFYAGAQKDMHIVEFSMKPSNPACIKVTVKRRPVLHKYRKRGPHVQHPCPKMCAKVQRKLHDVLNIVKQTWIHGIEYEFQVACEACSSVGTPAGDSGPHLLSFYECTYEELDEVFCPRSGCSVPTEIYKKRFKLADSGTKQADDQRNGNHSTNLKSTSSDGAGNQSNICRSKRNINGNSLNTTQENDSNQSTVDTVTDSQLSTIAGKMGAE